jgi:hypothetical protein
MVLGSQWCRRRVGCQRCGWHEHRVFDQFHSVDGSRMLSLACPGGSHPGQVKDRADYCSGERCNVGREETRPEPEGATLAGLWEPGVRDGLVATPKVPMRKPRPPAGPGSAPTPILECPPISPVKPLCLGTGVSVAPHRDRWRRIGGGLLRKADPLPAVAAQVDNSAAIRGRYTGTAIRAGILRKIMASLIKAW